MCIGAAHEKNYQHHLEQAYLALHGQDKPVNVRIQPEPLNPMDPSAIAIDVDYGTGWTHIGYIASQLCEYLHPLIAKGDILGPVYMEAGLARLVRQPGKRDEFLLCLYEKISSRLPGQFCYIDIVLTVVKYSLRLYL